AERRDAHFAAPGGCVDEAIVAEVNPDVRKREAARVEKNEVAGLEIVREDVLADAAQLFRRSRQRDAGHLLEHIPDESSAVETAFRRFAARPISDAHRLEREQAD